MLIFWCLVYPNMLLWWNWQTPQTFDLEDEKQRVPKRKLLEQKLANSVNNQENAELNRQQYRKCVETIYQPPKSKRYGEDIVQTTT